MLCLVVNLNLIIGKLVPKDDKYWDIYLTLREIVIIVSSTSINILTHNVLKTTVYKYLH